MGETGAEIPPSLNYSTEIFKGEVETGLRIFHLRTINGPGLFHLEGCNQLGRAAFMVQVSAETAEVS